MLALDFSVTSPDNAGHLRRRSDLHAFKAADEQERKKSQEYETLLTKLTPPLTVATSQYTKVPIVMESTGAWGNGMQRWWKQVLVLHNRVAAEQAPYSRRHRGLDHTWSANSFSSYWAQRISCAYMRNLAESIELTTTRGRYSNLNG